MRCNIKDISISHGSFKFIYLGIDTLIKETLNKLDLENYLKNIYQHGNNEIFFSIQIRIQNRFLNRW